MSWSTIRSATPEDTARLNAAAERFARRHELGDRWNWEVQNASGAPPYAMIEYLIDNYAGDTKLGAWDHSTVAYLKRLWRAAIRRALRTSDADGIAYGHVGFYVR